jgi:hypothetical protein
LLNMLTNCYDPKQKIKNFGLLSTRSQRRELGLESYNSRLEQLE